MIKTQTLLGIVAAGTTMIEGDAIMITVEVDPPLTVRASNDCLSIRFVSPVVCDTSCRLPHLPRITAPSTHVVYCFV